MDDTFATIEPWISATRTAPYACAHISGVNVNPVTPSRTHTGAWHWWLRRNMRSYLAMSPKGATAWNYVQLRNQTPKNARKMWAPWDCPATKRERDRRVVRRMSMRCEALSPPKTRLEKLPRKWLWKVRKLLTLLILANFRIGISYNTLKILWNVSTKDLFL